MGTYGSVVTHTIQPMPATEALNIFRKNVEKYVQEYRNNKEAWWANNLASLLQKHEDTFALLEALAAQDRWSASLSGGILTISPPFNEVKGGIRWDFVDFLCPFVTGYMQIEYEHWDDHRRVVWKDGKPGRETSPIWSEPE